MSIEALYHFTTLNLVFHTCRRSRSRLVYVGISEHFSWLRHWAPKERQHEGGVVEVRAQRFPADDSIIAIYRAPGRVRRISGRLRDVSKTGVYFYADFHPQEGSAIQLILTFPRDITYADPVPARCNGRIVRVEPSGRRVGIAVQLGASLAVAV